MTPYTKRVFSATPMLTHVLQMLVAHQSPLSIFILCITLMLSLFTMSKKGSNENLNFYIPNIHSFNHKLHYQAQKIIKKCSLVCHFLKSKAISNPFSATKQNAIKKSEIWEFHLPVQHK